MTSTAKTFEVGTTYMARSICDYDCIYTFTVERRSAKCIWIKDTFGKVKKRGVRTAPDGIEWCLPLGSFSMAPSLQADRPTV